MNVIIDTRETKLIRYFSSYPDITVQSLDVGDVWIQSPQVSFIIERKTISDVMASIKDGRYREQKQRLQVKHQPPSCRVFYIIEGTMPTLSQSHHSMKGSTVIASVLHTIFRDGYLCYKTRNIQETAEMIQLLIQKVKETPHKILPTTPTSSPSYQIDTIKVAKKANMNPARCYQLQLCQIPKVSYKSATIIQTHYPSWTKLIECFESVEDIETRPYALAELRGEPTTTGKTPRKLGKKLSETIYEYLQLS